MNYAQNRGQGFCPHVTVCAPDAPQPRLHVPSPRAPRRAPGPRKTPETLRLGMEVKNLLGVFVPCLGRFFCIKDVCDSEGCDWAFLKGGCADRTARGPPTPAALCGSSINRRFSLGAQMSGLLLILHLLRTEPISLHRLVPCRSLVFLCLSGRGPWVTCSFWCQGHPVRAQDSLLSAGTSLPWAPETLWGAKARPCAHSSPATWRLPCV